MSRLGRAICDSFCIPSQPWHMHSMDGTYHPWQLGQLLIAPKKCPIHVTARTCHLWRYRNDNKKCPIKVTVGTSHLWQFLNTVQTVTGWKVPSVTVMPIVNRSQNVYLSSRKKSQLFSNVCGYWTPILVFKILGVGFYSTKFADWVVSKGRLADRSSRRQSAVG